MGNSAVTGTEWH